MNKKNNKWVILAGAVLILAAGFFIFKIYKNKSAVKSLQEITAETGTIKTFISTTGTIQPRNRLEITPTISGRIESILVKEGDRVKAGQIVAWMSSTERAALIDAARSKDKETVAYWENAYKATPIIAPIEGEIIARSIEPGQSVTQSSVVLVISDKLIVLATVDEADIGKVKLGQKAVITLDAYPDTKIPGKVNHISFESTIVNNVIIYEVDVVMTEIPSIARSGMGADVEILESIKENIVCIPLEAVVYEKDGTYVLVKTNGAKGPEKRKVELGIFDDKKIEIVSGITQDDVILVESNNIISKKQDAKTNPFMPSRRRSGSSKAGR